MSTGDVLRWSALVLLLGLIGIVWFTRYSRVAEPQPPDFEVVSAPADRPLEITYGPSRLTVDAGGQVVLPRTGRLADREVTLQRGRVTARVRALSHSEAFAVRTAQAVAGVRGTQFSVALDERQRTTVTVEEGSVEVTGLVGNPVILMPGQTAIVDEAQPPVMTGLSSVPSTPWDLPPTPAYQPPPREPGLPDHTTQAGTSEPELENAARPAQDFARPERELDEKTRRELMLQNAQSNNPAPSNPAPQSPQPRSLR